MYYYFFGSRNNVKEPVPVVLWLAGGPGCSGAVNLFNGIGPYYITNELTLRPNEYGWDKVSNIIFVDQPIETGFSYSPDKHDIRHDQNGVSNDLYGFLQGFFTKHHHLAQNDFYIAGESYAGHYIPALATRIQRGNKLREGTHIKLKGFAIGNGLTNSGIQYEEYTEYALMKKLIEPNDKIRIDKMFTNIKPLVQQCGTERGFSWEEAFTWCEVIYDEVKSYIGKRDEYDIRKECGEREAEFLKVVKFLNIMDIRNSLGVGDREFKVARLEVFHAMREDIMKNLAVYIPALLKEGLKVLIYAGEEDLRCNHIGILKWVEEMVWYGQVEFKKSKDVPFFVDGKQAGQRKTHGLLTFLKVNEAGHSVPMDQPKVALQMIQQWMAGANDKACHFVKGECSEIEKQDAFSKENSDLEMEDAFAEESSEKTDARCVREEYPEIQMQDASAEDIQKYRCKIRPRKMERKGNKRLRGKWKQ